MQLRFEDEERDEDEDGLSMFNIESVAAVVSDKKLSTTVRNSGHFGDTGGVLRAGGFTGDSGFCS